MLLSGTSRLPGAGRAAELGAGRLAGPGGRDGVRHGLWTRRLKNHPRLTFLVVLLWGIGAALGFAAGVLAVYATLPPAGAGKVRYYDQLAFLPVYLFGVLLAAGAGGWLGARTGI